VFPEVDDHIVAEVFSGKIFKEEPSQEDVEARPPATEYGGQAGSDDQAESDVSETNEIAGQNVLRQFVGQVKEKKDRHNKIEGVLAKRSRQNLSGQPHGAASSTRMWLSPRIDSPEKAPASRRMVQATDFRLS